MKRLMMMFAVLCGAIILGLQLKHDPGYVLIALNHWTIETTLWFFCLLIIITFYALHLAIQGTHWVMRLPHVWHAWRMSVSTQKKMQPSKKALQQQTYLSTLNQFIQQHQAQFAANLIKKLPRTLRANPEIIRTYVIYLLKHQQTNEAKQQLQTALKHQIHPELLKLLGIFKNAPDLLAFTEKLRRTNPHNADLLLSMGQLCHDQKLWGKAKSYLDQSLMLHETAEAYEALGLLMLDMHDEKEALHAFQKGLHLVVIPPFAT